MRYPKLDAVKNPCAVISAFNGVNRLYAAGDGEGEYKNLSPYAYPCACSYGFGAQEPLYIIENQEPHAVSGALLQCVFEVKEVDGKKYMTGVYGGDFYFEGVKIEYDGDLDAALRIKAGDSVNIARQGSRYIINADGGAGLRAVWEYSSVGSSYENAEIREKDGLLQSGSVGTVIKKRAPIDAFIAKLTSKNGQESRTDGLNPIYYLEKETKKSYYFIGQTRAASPTGEAYGSHRAAAEEYEKFFQYAGMTGAELYVMPQDGLPEGARYKFNDRAEEHPIRFIIDYAGQEAYKRFMDAEKAKFDIGELANVGGYPYLGGINGERYRVQKYTPGGGAEMAETESVTNYTYEMQGIIGHFEKWNEGKKRYEYYPEDYAPELDGIPIYSDTECKVNTAETVFKSDDFLASGIRISFGLASEGLELSHTVIFRNRLYGTVRDGSMVMWSAWGEYSKLASYALTGADSGFIQSGQGEYTAICQYSGAIIAFSRTVMEIYYPDETGALSLSRTVSEAGCISQASIAEVGGYLFYLGEDGFYAYSGGVVRRIGQKLNTGYRDAAGYVQDGRYIAVCERADGLFETLMFDLSLGAWYCMSCGCGARGAVGGAVVWKNGTVSAMGERNTSWSFETGDLFEGTLEDKGINDIYIRARLDGRMKAVTITDEKEAAHAEFVSDGSKIEVFRVPVRFVHGNYYRIRLEGSGKVTLYAIERRAYAGGKTK